MTEHTQTTEKNQPPADKVALQYHPTEKDLPQTDKDSPQSHTDTEDLPPPYTKREEKAPLPSHSPLAFSIYPPLYNPSSPNSVPRPKFQQPKAQQYTSAERMKAILNTGSSSTSSKQSSGRFEERDPSNSHEYLQGPDRRYTHPRLNIFGRDIVGDRSSNALGWGRRKK